MQRPAVEAKIMLYQDGLSVLAGKHAVSDMLVFLMYRKLKGKVEREHVPVVKPVGSGSGE